MPGGLPDIHKIAVLRANGIGDLVFSLPALDALRSAYPDAEIVLLANEWHAAFLTNRPGPVDRVVVLPPTRGVGRPDNQPEPPGAAAERERFFAAMAAERFDLALQLHGGGRNSNPFVLRLGARLTAGLKAPEAPPLDRVVPYRFWQHEILRSLEVVSLVGATARSLEPRLAVTPDDLAEARGAAPFIVGEQRVAVVHPGVGDPSRRWPPERFAAVGDALAAAGARVVVTGAEWERDLVDAVIGSMRAGAVDLCCRLSLGGLAGLLASSALVVSNDTGPLHLATAVGTATAGIFWCGNIIIAAPLTRKRHRPLISWRLRCPECDQDCIQARCGHSASFVADVPVEEVIAAALDLLASAPRPAGQTVGFVPAGERSYPE